MTSSCQSNGRMFVTRTFVFNESPTNVRLRPLWGHFTIFKAGKWSYIHVCAWNTSSMGSNDATNLIRWCSEDHTISPSRWPAWRSPFLRSLFLSHCIALVQHPSHVSVSSPSRWQRHSPRHGSVSHPRSIKRIINHSTSLYITSHHSISLHITISLHNTQPLL